MNSTDAELLRTHPRFQVGALTVQVYPTATALAAAAARLAAEQMAACLEKQTLATAVWATGRSQLEFLDQLTQPSALDWSRVVCFHLDEYLGLDADHAASFRRYLRQRLADRVQPQTFHYLAGDALEPIQECQRYEALLRSRPIDLCCLGVGENGHLAFNDPGVARFDEAAWVKLVRLDSRNRQQQLRTGHFTSLADVPKYAFTLTLPAICSARRILCLASGSHKAKVVQTLLQAPISARCPASVLRQQPQAILLLDAAAAAQITPPKLRPGN